MQNIEFGRGLYQALILYTLKGKRKIEPFAAEVVANDPIQAFKLTLNAIYIKTGKAIVIKDNIVTLVIPDNDYFNSP